MKLTSALSSLLTAGCILGVASPGFAATCNNTQGTADVGTVAGNSCGNNANYNGSTFCGGVSFSGTGTDVWQVNVGATQNFTFSVASDAFQPDIALFSNSCADNSTCINGTDYEAPAAPPASTATSAAVTGNPAGTYFLVVTDSTGVGAQCGAYNLTLTGTVPVKLQGFSVQ
jgi:hypothetical protein